MKVGLLGVSGGVGSLFVRLALDAGHEIVALARCMHMRRRSNDRSLQPTNHACDCAF